MIPVTKIFPNLTRLHLAWQIEEYGWTIGDHTYGRPDILDAEPAKLHIGRFCSIGPNVTIILGNHRTDLITTYPFKTLAHLWPEAADLAEPDHESRGDTIIESDVWIGANATILPGVHIAPGAIIAAGAVVTASVPAYAIAAGNPARTICKRFDDATITRLLELAWWTWPDAKIRANLAMLMQPPAP